MDYILDDNRGGQMKPYIKQSKIIGQGKLQLITDVFTCVTVITLAYILYLHFF